MAYDTEDTIAAIASGEGGAARGIIRLSGPSTADCIISNWADSTAEFMAADTATCISGDWRLPDGRCLPCHVYFWPDSRSYTRQPTAEIHTIGSKPLLELVLGQVCRSEARLARRGEFTLRAFLAGRIDLSQAEAVLGVIEAESQTQLRASLAQLAGGLSQPLNELRTRLLDLCADVEAGLDFVDEHIEFVTTKEIARALSQVELSLTDLRDQIASRNQSVAVPTVLLRGRPNVGKSTLWNRMVEHASESAIVSQVPGTTRDFLERTLDLHGMACRLVDTAGIDAALQSPIDQQSQRLSQDAAVRADCVLLCLDGSRAVHAWERDCLVSQRFDVVVVNKTDLVSTPFVDSLRDLSICRASDFDGWQLRTNEDQQTIDLLGVSAVTGTGMDAVQQRLRQLLQTFEPEELKICGATAARCQACVERSLAAIRRAQAVTSSEMGQELLAAELREALDGLAEVVGEIYTDDILDRVFSRFCIGK